MSFLPISTQGIAQEGFSFPNGKREVAFLPIHLDEMIPKAFFHRFDCGAENVFGQIEQPGGKGKVPTFSQDGNRQRLVVHCIQQISNFEIAHFHRYANPYLVFGHARFGNRVGVSGGAKQSYREHILVVTVAIFPFGREEEELVVTLDSRKT